MTHRMSRIALAGLVAAMAASAARAETLEDVEKTIAGQSKKITSMSMKMNSVTEASGPSYKTKTTLDGTYEFMRDGKKTLARTDTVTRGTTEAGGIKQSMDSKTLSISDGDYTYTLSDSGGQKYATKMKSDNTEVTLWRDDLRQWYDIKLLPDETIDGKPCFVLELTPKKSGPMAESQGKNQQYYQKDTCALVKGVAFGPDGKPISTTTYSDIKINPTLGRERFKFTPPPGVKVEDITAMQNAAGAPPAGGK